MQFLKGCFYVLGLSENAIYKVYYLRCLNRISYHIYYQNIILRNLKKYIFIVIEVCLQRVFFICLFLERQFQKYYIKTVSFSHELIICVDSSLSFCAKLASHMVNLKGFFSSCTDAMCPFKCPCCENLASQIVHLKIFFPS